MNFLDRIPTPIRHALIGLLAAVISYATANYSGWVSPDLAPLVGAALGVLVLWVTPFTAQYGVGSSVLPVPSADPAVMQDEV